MPRNARGLTRGSRVEAERVDGVSHKVIDFFSLQESVAMESKGFEIPLQGRVKGSALPSTRQPLRVRFRLTRGSGNPQIHGVYIKKNA